AVARPDLLAVDDEMFAVETPVALQRGQVGPGVRFRETLAPDFIGAEDAGQETRFLRLGPERDDGGTDHAEADDVGHRRCACPRQLLPENHLLHEAGTAPAVLARPGNAGPAAVVQRLLPRSQECKMLLHRPVAAMFAVFRGVLFEPGAQFIA